MARGTRSALVLAVAVLAAALAFLGREGARGEQNHGAPPGLVRQFVGGGGWQHRNDATRQTWHVQLKRFDDGSLSGRVLIVGSPLLDHAEIQGQVTGSEVDGVLLDDGGRQVGTFSGTLSNGTVSGTYTTADGDLGNWRWDGKLPN
jgi:hypothetical protein